MQLQAGLTRQFRRLGWLMGIPATVLISAMVLRFVNQSSLTRVPAPGVVLPDNKIVLEKKPPGNVSQLNEELENKENERIQHKLVSLDFPGTEKEQPSTAASATRPESAGLNTTVAGSVSSLIPSEKILSSMPGNVSEGLVNKQLFHTASRKLMSLRNAGNLSGVGGMPAQVSAGGFNDYSKSENIQHESSGIPGMNDVRSSKQELQPLVVHALALGDQKVHQGSVVKFRAATGFTLNTNRIGRNSIIYAYASFDGNRLKLFINKVNAGQAVIPVHLICQDEDEKVGIALNLVSGKWAETAETGKNSAVDEVSSRLPVGSGLISQVGHKLFSTSKGEEYLLADGAEIVFVPASE